MEGKLKRVFWSFSGTAIFDGSAELPNQFFGGKQL